MTKVMRYERVINNCLECPFSHEYTKYGLFKTEKLGLFCTATWFYIDEVPVKKSDIMHVGVGKNMDKNKTYVRLSSPTNTIPDWCPLEDRK